MVKAKRARKAETPKQPSLCLRLRAPYFYPDHVVLRRSLHQAEEARWGYGGMAVGPVHSKGVGGVMPTESPCSLEGTGSKA